jgi:type IV pilus assembly protein PilM
MALFKKENDCVGLDIGSYSIKAVEFKSKQTAEEETFEIKKIGYELLPRDAIVDGSIIDPSAVVETIKMVFDENKITNKNIVLSISGNSVIIKKISLPVMEKEELAESIIWEAKHNIPYPYEETNVDYVVLRPSQVKNEKNIDVLLVAAKKDKVTNYSSVITQAGRKPEAMEVDVFALQNAVEVNYRDIFFDQTIAVINMGANITNVIIIDKGTPQLFRDLAIGGSIVSENLSKDLNINFEEAEKLMKGFQAKDLKPEQYKPALESNIKNIIEEVGKTFSFYEAGENRDSQIELILLCGGFSKLQDLTKYFDERFKLKTEILNPFRNVTFDEKKFDPSYIEEMAVHFGVASGLATRKKEK